MIKYLIQHRIRTKAICEKPFDYNGIHFEHYVFNTTEGWPTDYWLASGEVEANSWHEAVSSFRGKLSSIMPKVGFISQCAMEFLLEPFFVLNPDYSEKIVYVFYSKDVDGTSLHFRNNETDCLNSLDQSDLNLGFYDFMVESTNASTAHTSLYMLFSALESISQKKRLVKCEECEHEREINGVDADTLKGILGGKLYNQCWGNDGLRHKIAHGEFPKLPEGIKEKIYRRIVKYVNESYGISINEQVVGPQRTFTGNKQAGHNFYRYYGAFVDLNLRECCEILDNSWSGEKEKLEHVGPNPHKDNY